MADIGSFDTSSYPRAQPQQSNPLAQIMQLGQVQSSLGDLEVGRGVQEALDPNTGQIDRNKLAGVLKQTRAGSSKAIPTLDALEKLRSAGFGADSQGLDTLQKRFALTSHMFGSIADKGDKATMADVYKVAKDAMSMPGAKELGIDLPMVMSIAKRFHGADGKPMTGKEIAKQALDLTTQSASSAEVLAQHSPQYTVIDDGQNKRFLPTGTKANPVLPSEPIQNRIPPTAGTVGPGGQPQLYGEQGPSPGPVSAPVPGFSNNFKGIITGVEAGPVQRADLPPSGPPRNDRMPIPDNVPPVRTASGYGQPKGPAVAPEPGFSTGIEGEAQRSIQMANELTSSADESPAAKAIIGNLEKELKNFTPGVGADYKRLVSNFANANLPLPESWKKDGALFDPSKVASQEEFNKQVETLIQSQFKAIGGTGTDAKLNSAKYTSPNELMSKDGIKRILGLLKGNQDAIEVKNDEWRRWREQGNGPQTYAKFSSQFNKEFDPRVFQFRYLDKKERQKYFNQIEDSTERKDLLRKVEQAHDKGWVTY